MQLYLFLHYIFVCVSPMQDVSANKLRNMIRLKTLGFFGNARISVIVQLYLLPLCVCVNAWLMDHILLVLGLVLFFHKISASFNTQFWLNDLLPPHNFFHNIRMLSWGENYSFTHGYFSGSHHWRFTNDNQYTLKTSFPAKGRLSAPFYRWKVELVRDKVQKYVLHLSVLSEIP